MYICIGDCDSNDSKLKDRTYSHQFKVSAIYRCIWIYICIYIDIDIMYQYMYMYICIGDCDSNDSKLKDRTYSHQFKVSAIYRCIWINICIYRYG